jgi:putative ABC transport system permease protein
MLTNYLRIAWRNMMKHRFSALINITGLATGLLFTLLIGAFVWNELQVNRSLRNAKSQYFLTTKSSDPNFGVDITTIGPLAKRLKEDYPTLVANYYRWDGITSVVSKGEKHLRENIQLGDSTLLSMYGFGLQHGDARTALNNPFSVVIKPELALKYFGRKDVVGETLTIQSFSGGKHDFLITGVLNDIPENTVTQLNDANHNTIFIPTNTYTFFGRQDFDNWGNIYIPSYIELREGVEPKDLEEPIRQLISENASAEIRQKLTVVPVALTDYYLQQNNGLVERMLYTLSIVGLFILGMAVVNFINLSIGSAGTRMKEIGMRKVLGSQRRQLIQQFLAESIFLTLGAALLALAAYSLTKSLFGEIVGKDIPSLSAFPVIAFIALGVFVLLIGTAAGLYPALVLSSFNSIDTLKGKLGTVKENVLLRKTLVGFQFGIAAVVMIAAFVVSQQVSYFFSRNLGYDKEYIVSSQVPRDWTPAGVQKMLTVRNEFAAMPQIAEAALSYEIPNGMNGAQPPVYKLGSDSTSAIAMQSMQTDGRYLSTYKIPLIAGSFLTPTGESDSGRIVLNEKAVQALGFKNADEAVGEQVRIPDDPTVFTVKGVTKDFHFGTMQLQIPPIIFFHVRWTNTYRYFSFKLKPGNVGNSIQAIEKKWATLLPGSSFEYSFMDETLAQLYSSELQVKKAAYVATALAFVIVLLGVLGLLSLSVQKKTKEIGVRKVLGASTLSIISLFLKEFLPVLFVGGLVSIPVAFYFMKGWLNNYAYRIELGAAPFVLTIFILGLVTTAIIFIQIAKASAVNPAKNLRTE